MLAVGCYGALDELGLRCPEDVSVVGFNDMPFIDRLRPPLSTVRFPHYQLGTEAAKLILERIESGEGPVKILYLAPELVARGSTVPLAPKAVPDLPAEDDARDPEDTTVTNTVPLRRGVSRRGR
jgi:LacI family transcriptional regulator